MNDEAYSITVCIFSTLIEASPLIGSKKAFLVSSTGRLAQVANIDFSQHQEQIHYLLVLLINLLRINFYQCGLFNV